jgi:hypothetical protein
MPSQLIPTKLLRAKALRILCALGLGLALTACDQCGDFKLQMQVCRQQAPAPGN